MVHRLGIEGFGNMPDMVPLDDRRRTSGQDAIFVVPGRGGKAGLETVLDRLGIDDGYGGWTQVIVE
jgi:hypothetical protein